MLGSDKFWSTPLGEAPRRTIDKAVAAIMTTADRLPWQRRMVDFDDHALVINAGHKRGVKPGDRCTVEHIVGRLTDCYPRPSGASGHSTGPSEARAYLQALDERPCAMTGHSPHGTSCARTVDHYGNGLS